MGGLASIISKTVSKSQEKQNTKYHLKLSDGNIYIAGRLTEESFLLLTKCVDNFGLAQTYYGPEKAKAAMNAVCVLPGMTTVFRSRKKAIKYLNESVHSDE